MVLPWAPVREVLPWRKADRSELHRLDLALEELQQPGGRVFLGGREMMGNVWETNENMIEYSRESYDKLTE